MKISQAILGLSAGVVLLLAGGCGKEQPPAGETPKAMNPPASDTPKAAKAQKPAAATSEAQKAIDTQRAAAEQTMKGATNQAAAPAAVSPSAMDAQAQGLIDKAKSLVTNEKYKEALTVVQQLSSQRLTPEQRSLVDDLKAQIQTALAKATASDAASALGNALGGKK